MGLFKAKQKGSDGAGSKDSHLDMTVGSIWRNMVAFAVPVFLGQLFQQLYNTADSIIVGNFSGKGALAAVSSSGNLIFMMTGFFMGLTLGAGVVISRYFGARDYKAMEAAVHTNIAFGAVCGVLMSALGFFLAPQMLILMNTPADVLPLSITYFRLYFLGAFFTLMYNTCMSILRAVGDSRTPLYYLIFSSVVNVVFDLIFVGPLRMGWQGPLLPRSSARRSAPPCALPSCCVPPARSVWSLSGSALTAPCFARSPGRGCHPACRTPLFPLPMWWCRAI